MRVVRVSYDEYEDFIFSLDREDPVRSFEELFSFWQFFEYSGVVVF